MSDEHDRIARLLREQGQAEAPPVLAGDVMAQVRREPQASPVHHGVNWRPVAAWAAVAAALLAVGVSWRRADRAPRPDRPAVAAVQSSRARVAAKRRLRCIRRKTR